MDRALVELHLKQALEHIALGERHIARQHEIVAQIKERGADSTEAERLLATFEATQAMHIAHRDRIEQELAAIEQHQKRSTLNPGR